MVVFSRLPSRLDSRTHFGAYAKVSSRFPFPSTGLLIDASHHSSTTTLLQLGRFACAVVMLPIQPGPRQLSANSRLSERGTETTCACQRHRCSPSVSSQSVKWEVLSSSRPTFAFTSIMRTLAPQSSPRKVLRHF